MRVDKATRTLTMFQSSTLTASSRASEISMFFFFPCPARLNFALMLFLACASFC